ncbi:hypothetical protein TI39_contig5902g00001 [Zymoseptoria brevis]|uniref:Uncharacterized protein n=1 Tax=Zymoseptoria brevis TaxID=1047168 RepID=A0A0F4G477_9PEZI|nr:hypothetical protein TI39_contig5902g00001 [Zymoseptoria brevis]
MNTRHHARTGSKGTKVLPPHARPAKPPVLKRGTSYNKSADSHHHQHSHSSGTKLTRSKLEEPADEDEESGMSSFLQYCATCERQIITPGSRILYCSEA